MQSQKCQRVFTGITEIRIEKCGLKELISHMFQNFTNLKALTLANNEIKLIDPFAFWDLERIEILSLVNNKLTEFLQFL